MQIGGRVIPCVEERILQCTLDLNVVSSCLSPDFCGLGVGAHVWCQVWRCCGCTREVRDGQVVGFCSRSTRQRHIEPHLGLHVFLRVPIVVFGVVCRVSVLVQFGSRWLLVDM